MQFIDFYKIHDELTDQRKNGISDGIATGWNHLDEYLTILKGQLNVVSGYPGCGKSEFVENLMCNLIIQEKWNCFIYAPENYPASKQARSLVEKFTKKQMVADYNSKIMTDEELSGAIWNINKRIKAVDNEKPYSFEDLLIEIEKTKPDMVIIDPFNEVESMRPKAMTETDYIGFCLMNARRLARKLNISFWIVCHPAKPERSKEGYSDNPPTMYDLSGSAHWYNKSDNAFIVHRYDKTTVRNKLLIKKIKNRHYGKLGEVEFDFQPVSGTFKEPEEL